MVPNEEGVFSVQNRIDQGRGAAGMEERFDSEMGSYDRRVVKRKPFD
jgi:hypothetical protein